MVNASKISKMDQKIGQKQAFLEFIENIGDEFLLNLYYLVCSYTNPTFEKILVPEIWAKMFSGNHFEGLFLYPSL